MDVSGEPYRDLDAELAAVICPSSDGGPGGSHLGSRVCQTADTARVDLPRFHKPRDTAPMGNGTKNAPGGGVRCPTTNRTSLAMLAQAARVDVDGLPDVDWYTTRTAAPRSGDTGRAALRRGGAGAGYGSGYSSFPGQPYSRAPMVNKPKSNLVSAILVTLFCCLPFGIVSIVYAAQVDSKWNAGDWRGAENASRERAKNWALVGLVAGLVFSVIYVLIVLGSATHHDNDSLLSSNGKEPPENRRPVHNSRVDSANDADVLRFLALAAGGDVELDLLALVERLVARRPGCWRSGRTHRRHPRGR